MPLPKIEGPNLKKPLCYDPARRKFIFFDDLVSRRERIVPVETLSAEDQRLLVIERQIRGEDYTVQPISGRPRARNAVVEAIERGEPFGRTAVEAEVSYLKDLLDEIGRNLP